MEQAMTKSLTIKCAWLQGLYWMSFCSIYSFASAFLLAKNFENQQIGILMAVSNIISVILQPTIGSLADKSSRISLKLIISCLASTDILFLTGMVATPGNRVVNAVLYSAALALMLTFQPLLNSLIFEYINEGNNVNYGIARGVGSVSFALISYLLGLLINRYHPYFLPFVCIGLLACMLFVVQTLPATKRKEKKEKAITDFSRKILSGGFFRFLKKYDRFPLFLLALAFLFIFHTIVNTYLVQMMQHLGGNDGDVGLSLMIAALCELPAMLGFGYLISKFKSGNLLKFSGFFYVVRSLLFLFSTSVLMLNFTQILQGLSFAIYVPASVYYVNQLMKKEDKVKGQTFIVGSSTLGSVFGSILGGWLLDHAGVGAMLLLGTVAAAVGCLLLFYSVKTNMENTEVEDSSL